MLKSKAAISTIVSIILLTLVAAITGVFFYEWGIEFVQDFESENELKGNIGKLEILGVKGTLDYKSVLGVRNTGTVDQEIYSVKLNGEDCNVLNSNIVGNVKNLELDCDVTELNNYEIEVNSNAGVFSKTLSVLERLDTVLSESLKISFDFGLSCINSTRIYGMNYTNNSHAELPSQSNYYYSACLSHKNYTIGTSCSGNYINLFYLAGLSNSPIYIDNSSAAPEPFGGYYNWQNVCVSSDGGNFSLNYGENHPGGDSVCVGSYYPDDVKGSAIGSCSMYSQKIWLDLQ